MVTSDMIGGFLLHSPFHEKRRFLWMVGDVPFFWFSGGERINKLFRGSKRGSFEILSLVRYVSLWAVVLITFFVTTL